MVPLRWRRPDGDAPMATLRWRHSDGEALMVRRTGLHTTCISILLRGVSFEDYRCTHKYVLMCIHRLVCECMHKCLAIMLGAHVVNLDAWDAAVINPLEKGTSTLCRTGLMKCTRTCLRTRPHTYCLDIFNHCQGPHMCLCLVYIYLRISPWLCTSLCTCLSVPRYLAMPRAQTHARPC